MATLRRGRRSARRFDVAFYVPWIGPLLTQANVSPTGGAETQVFLLARALAGRGSRVCLMAFEVPGVTLPTSIDGVTVLVRPRYLAHERFGKLREVVSLWKTVAAADAEVIVTRSAGPHVGLVALVAKLARRRFLFSSAIVSDFDTTGLSAKRAHHVLFGLGIRLADEIVVQTEEQVTMCKERFGRAPVLIRSIAEPAAARAGEPEAFLWIGRLVWYKRPLAYVELARAIPEAKFWMVFVPQAHSSEREELDAGVRSQAADVPNLELLSPRPRPELMRLIDRAVAVVNTADFEGMPNIFLEAWARGVPALALTHDPDRVIERNGLGGFASGAPEQLEELARELWRSRADQSQLAARCRAYIEEHHAADAVASRWQEVLRGGRARPAPA